MNSLILPYAIHETEIGYIQELSSLQEANPLVSSPTYMWGA